MLVLQLIQAGKGEALRIRAILRSLVPIEDLVGVISLPVQIPAYGKGEELGWDEATATVCKYTLCRHVLKPAV